MFRYARAVLAALQAIAEGIPLVVEALHGLHTGTGYDQGLGDRVAALELELGKAIAEAETLMLKAKGKFDAARAAEERQRRLSESAGSADDGDEEELSAEAIRAAYADLGIQFDNARGSREEEMPSLHPVLARRTEGKAAAVAAKWSRR